MAPGDTTTEWAAVQQELENARKARAEQRVKAASGEERSLYDVLQANKGLSFLVPCSPGGPPLLRLFTSFFCRGRGGV